MKFTSLPADGKGHMQVPEFKPRGFYPPKTNAQRQREFRKRNPDYYRLLHAERRAVRKAHLDAWRAENWRKEQEAIAAEAAAVAPAQETAVMSGAITVPSHSVMLALPAPAKPMLCLPAPVQDRMMEQLNALARLHKLRREAEALILSSR